MKEKIAKKLLEILDEVFQISSELYKHPETAEHEFMASQLLTDYLTRKNFVVERPYLDVETGFRAEYSGEKPGLNVGLFCEYDALPDIGHGCGHNLISAASIAAALTLKPIVDEIGGTITLFGTPAEETNGVKGIYGEKGAYNHIDIGMMAHPDGVSRSSGSSLAIKAIQYEYFGKCSHAAFAPEEGINALDSVILLFNGINALRQHLKTDVRIHGIIDHGGTAANMVPEYSRARFYIRAAEKEYLEEVEEKVYKIAQGAAQMTGARLKVSYYEAAYDNMVSNQTLSAVFDQNLRELTGEHIREAALGASMDMGNVSHLIPAIHPMVGVGNPALTVHTREFADCTVTQAGKSFIYKAALALACTAWDVMTDQALYRKIRGEFENNS